MLMVDDAAHAGGAPAPSIRRGWNWNTVALVWTFVVIIILLILNSLDRMVLGLVVDQVKSDFALTDFQISLVMGLAFGFFFALFGLPIGWLVDRVSRRAVLYIGVTVWSLATVFCGLSESFTDLLLARMLLAIGEATLGPVGQSLLADTVPRHRLGLAMSIYFFGGLVGNAASVAIGGIAVTHFEQVGIIDVPLLGALRPWQAVFVLVGLPGLVAAFLAFTLPEPRRSKGGAATLVIPQASFRGFMRDNRVLMLCLFGAVGGAMIVSVGIAGWMAVYLRRVFAWPAHDTGIALGIVQLLFIGIGSAVAGVITDKMYARGVLDASLRVFLVMIAVTAPIGVAAFLVTDPILHLALLGLFMLGGSAFYGITSAGLQLIAPPGLRGQMAALYLMCMYMIGYGAGSSAIGLLTDSFYGDPMKLGWSIATLIGIMCPIILVSGWLGLGHMSQAVLRQLDPPFIRAARGDEL